MSKVNEVLRNYIKESGIVLEQQPVPGIDPLAQPAPAVPPVAPQPVEDDSQDKTEHLTDFGYVEVVRDMLELVTIHPDDVMDTHSKIFSTEVNPKNAMDIHKDLQDVIRTHGSPTA